MNLTKTVLKRPVTVLMVLLCLVVFGCSSLMNATLEQMPDTNTPMLIISASYTGTSPEDVDELVTQPIENAVSTLEGVKSISSTSSEGRSMVMLEYGYDQDMDEAYDALKKKVDSLRSLPDDVEPSIMEMNNNQSESIMLSVSDSSKENLYDFVDQKVVPELEKLSTAAEVSLRGGSSEYIKVELKSDMMKQYGVTLSNITSAISSADLSYPSGSAVSGNQELNVTTSVKNDTLDDLLRVPITGSSGKIVYLEDIADIYYTQQNMGGVSRYNGEETISITVTKVQSASAMELSSQVKEAVNSLMADNESLEIDIVRDSADTILDSLKDVAVTMLLAVVISMLVLFLFFGDVKASLIVGSSIPVSILVTLIVMTSLGMSLNVITMSGLVLSVGMMVDNSIVTLESCFRAKELVDENDKRGYALAALTGTGGVIMSIIGSTLTTCV
ncbi:MAG: efflux RND transporter permease subunit, partial [Eubacteriales bacterium]|nr:efflux RND transporter permease subunit [Eubacteriales bacterium]